MEIRWIMQFTWFLVSKSQNWYQIKLSHFNFVLVHWIGLEAVSWDRSKIHKNCYQKWNLRPWKGVPSQIFKYRLWSQFLWKAVRNLRIPNHGPVVAIITQRVIEIWMSFFVYWIPQHRFVGCYRDQSLLFMNPVLLKIELKAMAIVNRALLEQLRISQQFQNIDKNRWRQKCCMNFNLWFHNDAHIIKTVFWWLYNWNER